LARYKVYGTVVGQTRLIIPGFRIKCGMTIINFGIA
jgi:hypothetical protein